MNDELDWLGEKIVGLIEQTTIIAINVKSLQDRIAALEDKVARLEKALADSDGTGGRWG